MSVSSETGDIPHPSTKKVSILRQIQRGLVIKGYDQKIGHNKYYIFLGFTNNYKYAVGFFINSEPSLIIMTNPDIANLQITIPPKSYAFLKKPKESYINCLRYHKIDPINLINGLMENPSRICGYLSPKHLLEVTQAVQNNQTMTIAERNIVVGPIMFPPYLCPITNLL